MKSIKRKKSLRKKKSIRRKKSPIRRKSIRRKSIRRKNKFKYDGVIIDEFPERPFEMILSSLEKNDIDILRQVSKTVENDIKINSAKLNKKESLKYINNTDNFREERDNLDLKKKVDIFLDRKEITNLHLNLYKCRLRDFPSFEPPNEKIVVLNLSDNYIKIIPDDIGIKLPKLRILDLSYCELKDFPNFKLDELVELNLNENDIKTIPDDIGIKLPKLEVLKLSYCDLRTFPNDIGIKLPGLQKLDLSNCKLTVFPNFEPLLNNLVELNLSKTMITIIPDDIGIKLPKLQILNLGNCGLTSFPHFKTPLNELTELNLKLNSDITTIPDDIGINLPKLQILDLSYCGLTDFPNFELNELLELDLSLNNIIRSTIPVNRFGKLISSDGIIYSKLPKLEKCLY
uniref:L domain-like protein n=1 Tax=viral metagenome TaxID=1070528 RepID=A0A6C0IHQ7_9ZZZZ